MRAPRLSMTDMIKVTRWIQTNKDTLLQMSQSEVARRIHKELGVSVTPQRVSEFEQAAGLQRQRGNVTGARKDRTLVVASELVRLMQQLGVTPSEALADITLGK